ncbi:MAG: B12-binding domain-containing radical SAM protein [Desulfuromonadales bacterium]|nr:B12-binding domain-containing radical SAM protein [Desulfuromonadales bacterium]MBN2792637.1 B12-binding domain-containing radical SAM protein [Desulfuromonadales bacterium]
MKTLLTTLHSKYIHASLALPCLAAYCAEDCGEILIKEFSANEPKEALLAQIAACHADVVCFSVYLWNRTLTFELVECLKRINPQMRIVLGGPEVSFEESGFFIRYPVDALICGEGERPLRHLLLAWSAEEQPQFLPGLRTPFLPEDRGWSLLETLDDIPSPFLAGLVDVNRGLVYYESSRGCPYTCSFCMSALDEKVRSYSFDRIKTDLKFLIDQKIPLIKFVDRTFNYHSQRTRDIFSYIVEKNRSSQFHFEIGAHLLDQKTLQLLESVPEGTFQFEIGVQSTLPQTLNRVGRKASLEKLAENVRYLREKTTIHLHLDLIAGLPGESYAQCLDSLDWTADLGADHLQIEPVKLLPGAPLRLEAPRWGIVYDPNPPYTILKSADMEFDDLERLRGIGRLFDLLINSDRFSFLMSGLKEHFSRLSLVLDDIDQYWREKDLYHQSRSLRDLYLTVDRYLLERFSGDRLAALREFLARDYARHERVVSGSAPDFFDTRLTEKEASAVRQRVKAELSSIDREGKVQYFAAVFYQLADSPGRTIMIFIYTAKTASGLRVEEVRLKL